jgi:predicted RNase H-like nuclease (RuvC/YqgF family)
MNDRELLEYIAAQVGGLTAKVDGLTTDMGEVKTRLGKIESSIENDIKPDIKLALQGYHDTNEKLTSIEEKLDNLSDKVDRHDIKIQVIEGGKRA